MKADARYPHMCRDGHVEIGHADSSSEQCPLCRVIAERDALRAALKAMVASYDGIRDGLTCAVVLEKLARADAALLASEGK